MIARRIVHVVAPLAWIASVAGCSAAGDRVGVEGQGVNTAPIQLTAGTYVTTDAVTNGHAIQVAFPCSAAGNCAASGNPFEADVLYDSARYFGNQAADSYVGHLVCSADGTSCANLTGTLYDTPLSSTAPRYDLTIVSDRCFQLGWSAPWAGQSALLVTLPLGMGGVAGPDRPFSVPFTATYCLPVPPPPPPPPSEGSGGSPLPYPPSNETCGWGVWCGTHWSPLVLNNTGNAITFTGQPAPFDLFGNGSTPLADWIGPGFGVLALLDDPSQPLAIESCTATADFCTNQIRTGAQLFGQQTVLRTTGQTASDGFEALAQYDDNHDGVIDASDDIFDQIAVWFDENGNGASDPNEVETLAELGVTSLSLADTSVHADVDAQGSYVGEDSTYAWSPFWLANPPVYTGELADVYFALQPSAADAGADGTAEAGGGADAGAD